MAGFETSQNVQPLNDESHSNPGNEIKKRLYCTMAGMLILTVVLFANNLIIYKLCNNLKAELSEAYNTINSEMQRRKELVAADDALLDRINALTQENRKLKEEYNKSSRGTEDLSKQLDMMKKKNGELIKQKSELEKKNSELSVLNKNLVDDNIALQNSLKMAASVGVKPQNFSSFEGLTSRNAIDRGKYLGKFLGTAYTPSREECGNDMGITNSGKAVIPGVSIAVDKRYWPFGTVFYIKGLGYTVAMDTGSGIKGKYRFDFCVFDKNFAKEIGSRKWDVYLVKMGNGKVDNIKL